MRNSVVRTLVLAMILLAEVNAHGQLTVPRPRPDRNGNSESYMQVEPVFTINGPRAGYTANAMRCHDYGLGDISTITAGDNLPVTWIMEASHPGDCYMYISYDGPDAVNFFKIAEFLGCGATDGLNPPATNMKNVTIPAELPPCDHCVLRWEWTSHQQVVNIEFYVQCVDVKIVSTAGPTKPTPMTAIAGIEHLPASASSYRAAYQGQNSPEYLVGPDVATYAPCIPGTAGCIGSGTGTSPPSPNPSPNPGPAPPSPGPPPCPAPTPPPPCPAPSPGGPPSPYYPPMPAPTPAPSPTTRIASMTATPDATTTIAATTSLSPTTTIASNTGAQTTAQNPTTNPTTFTTTNSGPTIAPNPPNINTTPAPSPSPDGRNSTVAPPPNPNPNPDPSSTTEQSPNPVPQNPPSGPGPDATTTEQGAVVAPYEVAIVSGSRRVAVLQLWIALGCSLLTCTSTQVLHQR